MTDHEYMTTAQGKDEFPNYCHACKTLSPLSEAEARWHQPHLCDSCEAQGLADSWHDLATGNF
jgi:hypothetical protein